MRAFAGKQRPVEILPGKQWTDSDDELIQFIFLPGFSTAESVTDLSGRGVGLDVVKSEVERIGGSVVAASEPGRFTRFTLCFPITISLIPSLLVTGGAHPMFGQQAYLVPVNQIISVQPVNQENFLTVEDSRMFDMDGQMIHVCQLSTIFDLEEIHADVQQKKIVIIGSPGRCGALLAEDILHEEDVVVHPIDPRIGKVQDVAGTAILKNGAGVLMLDAHDIFNTIQEMSYVDTRSRHRGQAEPDDRKTILVVEDSATVRELMKQVLAESGYEVLTGVDGQDGLNKFEQNPVDIIISDIDMPKMNGFEMVKAIRQSRKNPGIPIIMLSYKERQEDKDMALSLGANEYMTKADFDKGSILNMISKMI
ncbi:MAG: response regulator [Desulfobacteraceae bacterium]|nr:response regulator [Desulfobacteraceae bacterium]